jgi:hypothetical protein
MVINGSKVVYLAVQWELWVGLGSHGGRSQSRIADRTYPASDAVFPIEPRKVAVRVAVVLFKLFDNVLTDIGVVFLDLFRAAIISFYLVGPACTLSEMCAILLSAGYFEIQPRTTCIPACTVRHP